jgi:hypothetical protein
MTDYALVLTINYPGSEWALDGNDYATLQWFSDTPKPTQTELDAQWPSVDYANQCALVETARRLAYETQSDGLFFEWQRGDGTEAAWRAAVAAVKAAHPYPPAPPK